MFLYSVIVPAFNAENSLERCIASIIGQSYPNWELIVVDDGSTDNTLQIVEQYSKQDNRIRVFSQENKGPGAARNLGISQCKGDYIAFIDADDYYDKDYIELVDLQNRESPKDIVFVDFVNETKDGQVYGASQIYTMRNFPVSRLLRLQMTGKMPWGPVVKVIKKTLAKTSLFSNLDVGEEAIFSFEILRKSKSLGFVSKPSYHYVHNDNGQHTKGGLDPWRGVVCLMKEHLIECGCFDEYKSTLNSFAVSALCISMYRCSCVLDTPNALKTMRQFYAEYKSQYNLIRLDWGSIDIKTIIIWFCLRCKLYILIYFASKIRKEKQKN